MTHRFSPETIIEYLKAGDFEFELYEHPPVYTCEEAELHLSHLNALGTKNLFLREEKGNRVFLVSVPDSKQVDLGKLRYVLESSRLTFAEAELLWNYLGVEAGSVTILGIANDRDTKVELFIDQVIMEADRIQMHPLRNTASLTMRPEVMTRFLKEIGREGKIIEVLART